MIRWVLSTAIILSVAAAQEQAPDQPLCQAAANGDLATLRTLLAHGANPDVRDAHGETPLMRAAGAHMVRIPDERRNLPRDLDGGVRLLLDKHAQANARDPSGRTALLIAMQGVASESGVTSADEALARLLIQRGADVNAQDNQGWSPLLTLLDLWADQPSLVAFLLAKGADVNARLKDGRSGLMLVARLGKDGRLAPLLARGAKVNARDNHGATAVMVAAEVQWEAQSIAMLKFFAAHGADLNATDDQGRTAADRAAQAGYLERAKLLLDRGTKVADAAAFWKRARNYALIHAIDGGPVETARTLLEEGAEPDFQDLQGRTPLTIAANEEYSAEKTILLLGHGASVDRPNRAGDTPLMVAADRYQAAIVKELLDHGGDPNAVDRAGNTVLLRAAGARNSWHEERQPLIHLLLDKGADAARANSRGVTPLMLLAREGNPALPLLLQKPLDLNARDDEGNTALLYAARFFVRAGQRRDGWALLEKGADVNAANRRGETALILAATQFEPDAARLLLEKGAAVNARTSAGRTALMQAIDGPKQFDNELHAVYSPRIAELLLAAGADVNGRDAAGNTALSLAMKRGYEDMAEALRQAGAK